MNTRIYKIADYEMLKDWWQDRWGNAPAVYTLPQSGLIVSVDGRDVAAGWLYLDSTTPVALMGLPVTAPDNTARESAEALKCLLGGLVAMAKSQGRTMVLASFPDGSLSRLVESCGFVVQDTGMNHLTMEVT